MAKNKPSLIENDTCNNTYDKIKKMERTKTIKLGENNYDAYEAPNSGNDDINNFINKLCHSEAYVGTDVDYVKDHVLLGNLRTLENTPVLYTDNVVKKEFIIPHDGARKYFDNTLLRFIKFYKDNLGAIIQKKEKKNNCFRVLSYNVSGFHDKMGMTQTITIHLQTFKIQLK